MLRKSWGKKLKYNADIAAIIGGTIDGTVIGQTTPAIARSNIDEIVKAVSSTLMVAELAGTVISNYGQEAVDNLQALLTAAKGMSFVAVCGTAQASHYFRFQADISDKIYLDGAAGSDNGYVSIAAPVVGAMIVFMAFQTGATTFDWIASTVTGSWVAG